jgi:hypothetical protein
VIPGSFCFYGIGNLMRIPLSLEVIGATQDELKTLATQLPKSGKLTMKPVKDSLLFWKWKGFEVYGLEVPDSVNQKAENWPLDAENRTSLAELLQAFVNVCPRMFSLYSSPGGDLPKRESDVRLAELLEVISEGSLGHRVRYRVRELPPKILDEETAE